ncbi:MAG TPA: hypothetical protein VGP53_01730 [Acidimicrobiales bacterium]|nr:hypothetical protein [Acidimicrobiales bacterium]
MAYELMFWPSADEVMVMLEGETTLTPALAAVNRTLDRLAEDPYERRLRTSAFKTEEFGGVNATPVNIDSWYILWQTGDQPGALEIMLVHKMNL